MTDLPNEAFRIFAEGRFQALFSSAHPTIPVKFGDAPFKQPTGSAYVTFIVAAGGSFPASLGRQLVERGTGFVETQVFVPEQTGHAEAHRLAEEGARYFAYGNFQTTAGFCRFRKPHPATPLGVAGGFYRCSSRVMFEHDALVSRPN